MSIRNLVFGFLLLKATGSVIAQTYPTWAQYGGTNYTTNIATNYPPIATAASFPTLPTPTRTPVDVLPIFSERPTLAYTIVRSNGSLWSELTIQGKTWTTYEVQSSTDLKTWVKITEVTTGLLGGRVVKVPFETAVGHKFYQLVKY